MAATLFRNSHGQLIRQPNGTLMRNDGPCCCGDVDPVPLGSCRQVIEYLDGKRTINALFDVNPLLIIPPPFPFLECLNGCDALNITTQNVAWLDTIFSPPVIRWFAGAVPLSGICNTDDATMDILITYWCTTQLNTIGLQVTLQLDVFGLPPFINNGFPSPCNSVMGARFQDFFPFPGNKFFVSSAFLDQAFELPVGIQTGGGSFCCFYTRDITGTDTATVRA